MVVIEPFIARPIGDRVAATITASGIVYSSVRGVCAADTIDTQP